MLSFEKQQVYRAQAFNGRTWLIDRLPITHRIGADMASIPTMPPQTSQDDDFVPVKDMAEIGGLLRPGEIELLGAHGINPGVRSGLFSLQRTYVPAAIGVILQSRGK